jgi:hypothetical protein
MQLQADIATFDNSAFHTAFAKMINVDATLVESSAEAGSVKVTCITTASTDAERARIAGFLQDLTPVDASAKLAVMVSSIETAGSTEPLPPSPQLPAPPWKQYAEYFIMAAGFALGIVVAVGVAVCTGSCSLRSCWSITMAPFAFTCTISFIYVAFQFAFQFEGDGDSDDAVGTAQALAVASAVLLATSVVLSLWVGTMLVEHFCDRDPRIRKKFGSHPQLCAILAMLAGADLELITLLLWGDRPPDFGEWGVWEQKAIFTFTLLFDAGQLILEIMYVVHVDVEAIPIITIVVTFILTIYRGMVMRFKLLGSDAGSDAEPDAEPNAGDNA